jgi:penicillin amidase
MPSTATRAPSFSPARTLLAVLVLAVALWLGAFRHGPLPPVGQLLDPYHGMWSTAVSAELPTFKILRDTPGLDSSTRILYDARGVPHIFARTEHDAYFALGFVVARDRLVQLDLQTRQATGRLTELVGPAALPLDRHARALGFPRAAERAMVAIDTTSPGWHAARAYADGVNSWIAHMKGDELPLEYHLLGARPEWWTPINSFHLLNDMSYVLAYSSDEARHAAAAAAVGRAAADALFPVHSPLQEPIVPTRLTEPRLLGTPIPPPGPPDSTVPVDLAAVGGSSDRDVGSNNWAVAPRRTAAGAALLAGDPHLELTLPSIWYEAHLVVPGQLDVYGVTIPGAPGVIIGFNRDVAWTFTNVGADVLDYYAETVDDTLRPRHYMLDGKWHPIEARIETYRDPRGRVLAVDTLRFTHRGPLRRAGRRWLSMRWTALEPTDEMTAYVGASHATTVAQWEQAMEGFRVPAQNMLVADRKGTIAIRSNGRFPIRPGDGRGDTVFDGALSANDWTGDRPVSAWPAAVNPDQGYLASANQEPVDPAMSDAPLGTDWESPWRAIRINALLHADSAVTPEAMRKFQTDPRGARADYFVPYFLRAAARSNANPQMREAARLLAQWDRRYTRDNTRAVLFEAAMRELTDRTWDELLGPSGERVATPTGAVLAQLLDEPTNPWWDDKRTPDVVEQRDDILTASLAAAYTDVVRRYGPPDGGGWRWDNIRRVNIYHLLQIPQLSRLHLPVDGGTETLSPLDDDGRHGSSWRMVVQLGSSLRAWGIYPGGQSGNPLSRRYDDHLWRWMAGQLDSLQVPATPADLGGSETSILELDVGR